MGGSSAERKLAMLNVGELQMQETLNELNQVLKSRVREIRKHGSARGHLFINSVKR